jgi:uncharacterized coiled-coil protein SlyX
MVGRSVLLAVVTWGLPGEALAQWWPWWSLSVRVRALETRVAAHDGRIAALERQLATLGQDVTGLRAQVSGINSRLGLVETALRSYSGEVDCDAGGSLVAALNAAPPTAPVVRIGISGTCREHIQIGRDHVSLHGAVPGATIEAPPGVPITVFVTGRRVRLDDLVIRASADQPDGEALRVLTGQVAGANLRFEGGVSAFRNATLELFSPVIERAGRWGLGVFEQSYAFLGDCAIRDAREVGVQVESSAFSARTCAVERSSGDGVRAWQSALHLWGVSVVDSGQAGVKADLGSSVEISGGIGAGSRIAGSAAGLVVSGGSRARLGESRIDGNQDGVVLSDASVLDRFLPYSPRVTGNTGAGVRCAPPPAVPQVAQLGPSEVFGNGEDFVDCALP